jgi:hypothetical protein
VAQSLRECGAAVVNQPALALVAFAGAGGAMLLTTVESLGRVGGG